MDGPEWYIRKWKTLEKDKYCMFSVICGIYKTKQKNKYNEIETDS